MQHPGWALIVVGLLVTAVGAALLFAPAMPWLGHLPGDIVIRRENFQLYFPVATCIVLSLLLSGVMWVIRHFSG